MRPDGIIEDIDLVEKVDCVFNVTILETKSKGAIHMKINIRPMNKGTLLTRYHIPLPQEVQHQLTGATIFLEGYKGNRD